MRFWHWLRTPTYLSVIIKEYGVPKGDVRVVKKGKLSIEKNWIGVYHIYLNGELIFNTAKGWAVPKDCQYKIVGHIQNLYGSAINHRKNRISSERKETKDATYRAEQACRDWNE